MNKWNLYVRVAGTSANLGSGFDLLGLALCIYNHFYFRFGIEKNYNLMDKNGNIIPFSNKENLIKEAYEKYFSIFLINKKLIPFDVKMELNLPLKGGLGSSASALVAGFMAGEYIRKNVYPEVIPPSKNKLLYELAMMEGHPDNTTPALIGGFVFAYFKDNALFYKKYKFKDRVGLYLIIPKLQVETNDSRKKLPSSYSTADVVFNMSRITSWILYLNSNKFSTLKNATEDKIHTEYRVGNNLFYETLGEIINRFGGCFTLSGSGPTILIYIPKQNLKQFKINFLIEYEKKKKSEFPNFEFLPIKASNEEAKLIEKKFIL